jgi:cellulose synthase/poly-beta-1,6-N-acetylglucosamine synthase-like glycosyltransferase
LSDQARFEISALAQSVSIIITTDNHARFLAEAIESALGQTVDPGEVIVIDDGSTDDPGSVVSRYPRVQLVRQANQGLAAARNAGAGGTRTVRSLSRCRRSASAGSARLQFATLC